MPNPNKNRFAYREEITQDKWDEKYEKLREEHPVSTSRRIMNEKYVTFDEDPFYLDDLSYIERL